MGKKEKNSEVVPAFLRPEDAARYIGVSRRHLLTLTRRGVIKYSRLGRKCVLYARADLDAAVEKFVRGGMK